MTGARIRCGWVFSPAVDAAVFAGPLAVAALIVAWFASEGRLHDPVPPWLFAVLVIGCDVSHVWSTLFRTYLDPEERARSAARLAGVPLGCLAVGVALYAADGSGLLFWRALAYLAAFHFVRQQIGWMAYAARRGGQTSAWDGRLDRAAVYAATVYPLLWWHAHLPREFDWFVAGDFVGGLPGGAARVAFWLHVGVLTLWLGRQVQLFATRRGANPAKLLILGTTWLTWYGGIVILGSDIAFTATNVLAHGIPYMALVHRWGAARWAAAPQGGDAAEASSQAGSRFAFLFTRAGVLPFVGLLAAVAFVEEGLWDRLLWHDHASLFPLPSVRLPPSVRAVVVPLLALPQATHYMLDAWIWRTGAANPGLAERLGLTAPAVPAASAAGPAS